MRRLPSLRDLKAAFPGQGAHSVSLQCSFSNERACIVTQQKHAAVRRLLILRLKYLLYIPGELHFLQVYPLLRLVIFVVVFYKVYFD